MRLEVAARIGAIVQTDPLCADDYYRILSDPAKSPASTLERQYKVAIRLDAETMHRLAQEAESSGLGVRYLRSSIQEMLDERLFEHPDGKYFDLSVQPPVDLMDSRP